MCPYFRWLSMFENMPLFPNWKLINLTSTTWLSSILYQYTSQGGFNDSLCMPDYSSWCSAMAWFFYYNSYCPTYIVHKHTFRYLTRRCFWRENRTSKTGEFVFRSIRYFSLLAQYDDFLFLFLQITGFGFRVTSKTVLKH